MYNIYKKIDFLVFDRDQYEWHPLIKTIPNVRFIEHENTNISSTEVRKLLEQKKFEKIKTLIPFEIYEDFTKNE